MKAPIVLFAYNRPEHLRKTLEALAVNIGIDDSDLHVFIDGPRNEQDRLMVQEVITVVKSRQWCKKIFVKVNESNNGLVNQIIEGVTNLCKEKGKVIVLEDDLITSRYFIKYMNDALERYANEKNVMGISAYMYPIQDIKMESGFLRFANSWGWGTWERAWSAFEPNGSKLLVHLSSRKARYDFNINGSYSFVRMLKSETEGKIRSWFIRWYGSVFLHGGLCLFPSKSLVQNIGHDNTGINCFSTNIYDSCIAQTPITQFPKIMQESDQMKKALASYFRSIFLARIGQRIKREIKKVKSLFHESISTK